MAIDDVSADAGIVYRDEAAQEGIRSMLVVPIVVRGRIIGVMRLLTDEQRTFSQDEMDFAVALAEQGGMAIENARMFERIKG